MATSVAVPETKLRGEKTSTCLKSVRTMSTVVSTVHGNGRTKSLTTSAKPEYEEEVRNIMDSNNTLFTLGPSV